jgi:ABC-2 type transport system permease protein
MSSLGEMAIREVRLLRANIRTLTIVVAAPLLFAFIVGSVYSEKKMSAVPVVVIDRDNSATSRAITEALLATEPFIPGPTVESSADFDLLAAEGKAHACFVFPPHFERDLKSGKAPKVAALIDSSNLATGNVAATTAASVLTSYSVGADIRNMRLRGTSEAQARAAAMPISMQTRTLFNPALNGNYANFLMLGFIAIALQLSGLLSATQAGTSVLALHLHPRQAQPAIIIHVAITALIVSLVSWSVVRVSMNFLDLPMRGSEVLLLITIVWFIANLAAFSFGISCLIQDALFASQICAIVTLPNFLLSGFTWPIFAMPSALKVLAYALPMNPFVFALRKITMMGASLGDLKFEFGLLTIWSIAAAGLAVFGVFRLKNRSSMEAAI